MLADLAAENVDFVGARAGKTGVSFVLNSIRDDRTILTYKGANNNFGKPDIPDLHAPWLYISSMIGESWNTVVAHATSMAGKLAFNPSSYQACMGYEKLRVLTDRVSILVMNLEEACLYLGFDPQQHHDGGELAQVLARMPGQTAIVTNGAQGVSVYTEGTIFTGKPMADIRIMEATGAGDAFAATYTACHIRGMAPEKAVHFAMTNAESVLQHKGAKEKLLSWPELEATAARQSRQITSRSCQQTSTKGKSK